MGNVESPHFLIPGFHSESEIEIQDPEAVLVRDRDFCPVVTELVNNCLNAGAKKVTVTVEPGRIVVGDDVWHGQEDLAAILANIRRERPETTKPADPGRGFPIGGVGIFSCRDILKGYDGQLKYQTTEDGRLIAVATWRIK